MLGCVSCVWAIGLLANQRSPPPSPSLTSNFVQTDQFGATWRSLFRRGGHANPPEPITPQEPYASTSLTATLVR